MYGREAEGPRRTPVAARMDFPRIKRLPPYVFNVVGDLKLAARRAGEDIVDFSMGNPDGPTPPHVVQKLVEAVQKPQNHRYSVSRGIYKLRVAICDWYRRRYGVDLDSFRGVVEFAREHECLVVHDLAYADLCFDGYVAPSFLQVPGAKDVGVEFFTLSKSYNMPGWRVGFAVGNAEIIGALARIK